MCLRDLWSPLNNTQLPGELLSLNLVPSTKDFSLWSLYLLGTEIG